MVKKAINRNIRKSIDKFVEEIKKKYNVTAIILFGSYAKGTENENSDIDIAVYADDFELYLQLSMYLEEYFKEKGIPSDIFYVDLNIEAPIYCAPLNSQIQFTDYYPQKLVDFRQKCQRRLDEIKERIAV